jgi:hypothetical protein
MATGTVWDVDRRRGDVCPVIGAERDRSGDAVLTIRPRAHKPPAPAITAKFKLRTWLSPGATSGGASPDLMDDFAIRRLGYTLGMRAILPSTRRGRKTWLGLRRAEVALAPVVRPGTRYQFACRADKDFATP